MRQISGNSAAVARIGHYGSQPETKPRTCCTQCGVWRQQCCNEQGTWFATARTIGATSQCKWGKNADAGTSGNQHCQWYQACLPWVCRIWNHYGYARTYRSQFEVLGRLHSESLQWSEPPDYPQPFRSTTEHITTHTSGGSIKSWVWARFPPLAGAPEQNGRQFRLPHPVSRTKRKFGINSWIHQ